MVAKEYDWKNGAALSEHSKQKLKVLREYFYQYIVVRCQNPHQERFRLVVVDGFCGGGYYSDGTAGSPAIFVEELHRALTAINIRRSTQGLKTVEIECSLIFNDESRDAIEQLKSAIEPQIAAFRSSSPNLHLQAHYLNQEFEKAYPTIKQMIHGGDYRNALFNLDQCGTSHVSLATLADIMQTSPSTEIFYTFMIESLLAFLNQKDPALLTMQLKPFGIDGSELNNVEKWMSKNEWLGAAERLVFESFKSVSLYASPFSIRNPGGWRYWFLHFANFYRARQVYNDVLHDNATSQAHFGRSGLDMLSYDPSHQGELYLFDVSGRSSAKSQLMDDIPKLIRNLGDASKVRDFYEAIYNTTPAHADDIHAAIIENNELQVITPSGGERRKANTIDADDTIKTKTQRSFFPMFLNPEKK